MINACAAGQPCTAWNHFRAVSLCPDGVLSFSSSGVGADETSLGWRRRVLLAEVRRSPEVSKPFRHTRSLEAYCSRHSIKLETLTSTFPSVVVTAPCATPYASPSFTGSFPTSPQFFGSPEPGLLFPGRADGVPHLSLDGLHGGSHGKLTHSPPSSPPRGPRQLCGSVLALYEKLQSSPQVGVVHLALHSDLAGLIVRY